MPAPAPFLRWVGGKRRLLPALHAAMPADVDRFYEPFVGGGAFFFSVAVPGARCHLNDMNANLVAAYEAVRDNVEDLVVRLRAREADTSKEAYLAMRTETPLSTLDRAEWMIATGAMSFQGLHRLNRAGRLNTPYGYLTSPKVCNAELLRADSARLAGTTLSCGSYAEATATARAGDFVYLDPPYIPLSPTSSFTAYGADAFGEFQQRELAAAVDDLSARGVNVMLSNSDTPLTREIFASLTLHTVSVRRSISAKASSRGVITEVLGVNYPLKQMVDPAAFCALRAA